MNEITISYPLQGAQITLKHELGEKGSYVFMVASGLATSAITGVFGTCSSAKQAGDEPVEVRGSLLSYRWDPSVKLFRWHMLFQTPEADARDFTLSIKGYDSDGKLWSSEGRSLKMGNEKTAETSSPSARTFASSIVWPGSEDISAYENGFTAYGDLTAPVDILTLRFPNPYPTSTIGITDHFEDYTDEFVWFYTFSTLPSDTDFVLTMRDTNATGGVVYPYTS